MAARCDKGHRIEYRDPEIPGCVVCAIQEGRAHGRRDYDGRPLRPDEHASSCNVSFWGPGEPCSCAQIGD